MQWLYAITNDVPGNASASCYVFNACASLAPKAICPTKAEPCAMACKARSFLPVGLPLTENLALAPIGVDFDFCPPVLEYTSVSSTRILTFSPVEST